MKNLVKLAVAVSMTCLAVGCAPYQPSPNEYQFQTLDQPETQPVAPPAKQPAAQPRPQTPSVASRPVSRPRPVSRDSISAKVDSREQVQEVRSENHFDKDYMINLGMNKIEVVGPVFQKVNRGCSEVELFKFAVDFYQGKRVDNIIHIRMEESEISAEVKSSPTKQPSTTKSTVCKASALAISYVSVPLNEAEKIIPIVENIKAKSSGMSNEVDSESTNVNGSTLPEVYEEVNRRTGLEFH